MRHAPILPLRVLPFLALLVLAAGAVPSARGTWLTEDGNATIRIFPCGAPEIGMLCGVIAWLKVPLDDAGEPKTELRNPDPAMAPRPLCGLPLLWHFAPDGDAHWSGGYIYNPRDGKTYTATMTARPDGTLALRGYVGIPLLGESQIWTQATSSQQSCR
jgi:uncharacterized protein (DUF2147 family)